MTLIKMFTMLFILSIATLGSGEQENCREIPINGDKIFGECCVFNKDLRYKNDNKDHFLLNINHKSRQPLQDQKIKEVRPQPTNRDFRSPKTIIAAGHSGHEKSNIFVPASLNNLVVPFENDKLFGECHVLIKDEPLPLEIIVEMIQEYLSVKENFEERRPPLSERVPLIQSPKPPPHFNLSSISRKNDTVYLPENFEDVPNEEISHHQGSSDEAHIGIDDSDLDEKFNESTTKFYPESSLTYQLKNNHKHKVTDSIILKQHSNTTEGSTFLTGITEEADESTTPSKIQNKPALKTVKEKEDKSNNTVFEVTANTSITVKDLNSSNTNTSKKPIVDLDNRNAISVPPVECPHGQGRDPTGVCIQAF